MLRDSHRAVIRFAKPLFPDEEETMKTTLIGVMAAVAAITLAPIAQADSNAANLDQIVGQAYTKFQTRCTPGMTPQFQRVV